MWLGFITQQQKQPQQQQQQQRRLRRFGCLQADVGEQLCNKK
jgi:hypothetical protein